MTDCKCAKCNNRFTCDFALSVAAAKARMDDKGIAIKVTTIICSKYDLERDQTNITDWVK